MTNPFPKPRRSKGENKMLILWHFAILIFAACNTHRICTFMDNKYMSILFKCNMVRVDMRLAIDAIFMAFS